MHKSLALRWMKRMRNDLVDEEESPSAEAASGESEQERTERRTQISETAERASLQHAVVCSAPEPDQHGVGAPAVSEGGSEGGARRARGRVLLRGDYVTFTEYFHGEGAVGVMSIMGGFDVMQGAHDVVTERHGFPPHLCDATAFYADPSALCVADVVGAGAPCQGSLFAPHFGCGTEPDADDPRNAHDAEQVHVIGVSVGREEGEVDESEFAERTSSARLEARGHACELCQLWVACV